MFICLCSFVHNWPSSRRFARARRSLRFTFFRFVYIFFVAQVLVGEFFFIPFKNSINPIISISHKNVYKIPLFLIIGWRGAPKLKDEPQHLAQGRITRQILNLCGIKYSIIDNDSDLKEIKKLIKVIF